MAVLGLHCFVGFPLIVANGEYSLLAVCRLLIVGASLAVEPKLQALRLSSYGSWALGHRFNSCSAQAQLPHSMWDLSRPGIKPVSPASTGGFFTTEPSGRLLISDSNRLAGAMIPDDSGVRLS